LPLVQVEAEQRERRHRPQSARPVGATDLEDETQLLAQHSVRFAQRHVAIPDVRGFAARAIELDNRKVVASLEVGDHRKADIEPAEMEIGNFARYAIESLLHRWCQEAGPVAKDCALTVIADEDKAKLLTAGEDPTNLPRMAR